MKLNDITELFIKPDPNETKTVTQGDPTDKVTQNITVPLTRGRQSKISSIEIDQKIWKRLDESMDEANLPGPDYYEFVQSLNEVKDDIPQEDKQFSTVFKTMKGMGLTLQILLDSSSHYISVLKEEKEKFLKSLKLKFSETSKKQKVIETLSLDIEDMEKQVKLLSDKIVKSNHEIEKLESEIAEEKQKFEDTENNFNTTYNVFVEDIENNVVKIKKYLGGK
jgi:chromosome segregation ATPase